MNITKSSTDDEITPIALAIHEIVNRLPITMRTKNSLGIRIENGAVIEHNYTGPILEKVLSDGTIHHETPETGTYRGTPIIAVPVIENNEIIAAIGVVDTTKGIYSDIMEITKRSEQIQSNHDKGEFY